MAEKKSDLKNKKIDEQALEEVVGGGGIIDVDISNPVAKKSGGSLKEYKRIAKVIKVK